MCRIRGAFAGDHLFPVQMVAICFALGMKT